MFRINDTVKVNKSVHDEVSNANISEFVGTIVDIVNIGELVYKIEWDGITLNNIEFTSLQSLEAQMSDWDFTYLHEQKFIKVKKRCTAKDTQQALNTIREKLKT